MKVAVVKYNAGNIHSVLYALERIGVHPVLTNDEAELRSADRVIFPGVGEASSAMTHIGEAGLLDVLPTLEQPFLGICIGQQLMCKHSAEGDVKCLDIFPLEVKKFNTTSESGEKFKVPHMGWNLVSYDDHYLFNGLEREKAFVYYVHSYYCEIGKDTIATTNYVNQYSAALQRDNFVSVQFHPEKSGPVGQKILENFLNLSK